MLLLSFVKVILEEKSSVYQLTYSYDPAGNRIRMFKDNTEYVYTYNNLNQLTEENITSSQPRTMKIPVSGRLANAGNVNSVTVNGLSASRQGNYFRSLVSLSEGRNTITVKALNAAGSVLATKSISVTYSPAKRISYIYDNNGNLKKRQSELKSAEFSYDFENRLTKITYAGKEVFYEYDAEGIRRKRK